MKSSKGKCLKRFNEPYHAHELTFSCYKGFPLLLCDLTRGWFINALEIACNKMDYSILAFVIMPEHVHLIVYPNKKEYDISSFLKSIKQSVSRKAAKWLKENDMEWYKKLTINRKDGKEIFRFWQAGGGYDRNIKNHDTLIKMIEYIHNNPVRKGLVEDPAGWKWSSIDYYNKGFCSIINIDPLPW
jgi:putative transposase